jgi:class 3 adenylate cyclase
MEANLEAPRLERRLVAILAADIEGYSRHMERDEVEALATLSALRSIVDALIADHGGRITGTAGDSVLAEFASVVDALDCAVKMQREVAVAGQSLAPERRMQFRMGVNVGDVMVKDGDIFGDGVNIAARLETLALPGGICVSRGVRDHVRKMGQYSFEDLGEQSVKNIAQPIRAFRIRLASEAEVDAAVDEAAQKPERSLEHQDTRAGNQPASEPAPSHDTNTVELAFWDTIKESSDPIEFSAYLAQFPNGAFAALAEVRRTTLEQAAPAPSAADPVELAYWDTVKESDNPAMYAAYLEQYPEGSFATLAQVRLGELT